MTKDNKPEWEKRIDEELTKPGSNQFWLWDGLQDNSGSLNVAGLKSFISSILKSERERYIKAVEGIPVWKPVTDEQKRKIDETSFGALFTSGLLTQYETDTKNHNQAREEAIKRIKEAGV
jgi:fatty acid/phospholipid biosynthesis enzyme